MVSTLASQLAALRQGRDPKGDNSLKHRPSFLFTSSEAADLDGDAIHSIGLSGLAELEKQDPSLHKYEKLLFNRSPSMFHRENQSYDAMKSINQSIRSLLRALSPYFLLRPTHKILEFLIRCYQVQEHNLDDLLLCCLPYHTTPQFVRLIQLTSPKDKWSFLNGVKKTGAPLSRTVLASACASDLAVLKFICEMANDATPSRVVLSLFVSTTVEVLTTMKKVTEEVSLAVLPTVLEGIRSPKVSDFQSASYMVLAALVRRAELSEEVVKSLLEIIPKYANRQNPTDCLLLVVIICNFQRPSKLDPQAISAILHIQTVVSILKLLGETLELSSFLLIFIRGLVRDVKDNSRALQVLQETTTSLNLPSDIVMQAAVAITRTACDIYRNAKNGKMSGEENEVVKKLSDLLSSLALRYPNEIDEFVNRILRSYGIRPVKEQAKELTQKRSGDEDEDEEAKKKGDGKEGKKHKQPSKGKKKKEEEEEEEEEEDEEDEDEDEDEDEHDDEEREWLTSFLSHTFQGTRHVPILEGGTTLLLALEHPNASIRRAALLKAFQSSSSLPLEPFLADAILRRLQDEDASVVLCALSWEKLVARLPAEGLASGLSALVVEGRGGKVGKKTQVSESQGQALTMLCRPFLEAHPEYKDEVMMVLLGKFLLFPSTRKTSGLVLKLMAGSKHALFEGLADVKDSSKAELTGEGAWEVNVKLLMRMAQNIVRMEEEEMARMVELVRSCKCIASKLLLLLFCVKQVDESKIYLLACAVQEELTKFDRVAGGVKKKKKWNDANVLSNLSAAHLAKLFSSEEDNDNLSSLHVVSSATWLLTVKKLQGCKLDVTEKKGGGEERRKLLALVKGMFKFFCDRRDIRKYKVHIQEVVGGWSADFSTSFLSSFILDKLGCSASCRAHSLYMLTSVVKSGAAQSSSSKLLPIAALNLLPVLLALMDDSQLVRHAGITSLKVLAGLQLESKKPLPPVDLGNLDISLFLRFVSFLANQSQDLLYGEQHLPSLLSAALKLEREEEEEMGKRQQVFSEDERKKLQGYLLELVFAQGEEEQERKVEMMQILLPFVSSEVSLPITHTQVQRCVEAVVDEPPSASMSPSYISSLLQLHLSCGIVPAIAGSKKKDEVGKICSVLLEPLRLASNVRQGKQGESHNVLLVSLLRFFPADLYSLLPSGMQEEMLKNLCALVSSAPAEIAGLAKTQLQSLPLLAPHVLKLLSSLLDRAKGMVTPSSEQKARKQKTEGTGTGGEKLVELKRNTSVVSDVVQYHQDPGRFLLLLPQLFEMLDLITSEVGGCSFSADGDESLDQSLLSCLLVLVECHLGKKPKEEEQEKKKKKRKEEESSKDSEETKTAVEKGIRMEAIVRCLRRAQVPQTRHDALILLQALTAAQPRQVLQHVMSVFSFLGESGLVHDDHYSFLVIEQTLKNVVPPLIACGMEEEELLQVFVQSLLLIPAHRRMRLYSNLLMLLPSRNVLETFLRLLLSAKFARPSKKGKGGEEDMVAFAVSICAQFPLDFQLDNYNSLLETMRGMPENGEELRNSKKVSSSSSMRDLRVLQSLLIQVIIRLLSSRSFAVQVQTLPAADEETFQGQLLLLFERLILLQRSAHDWKEEEEDGKSKEDVEAKLDEALQVVSSHLSVSGFVRSISSLLEQRDEQVRQRALSYLSHKLELLDSDLPPPHRSLLLDLVPSLSGYLRGKSDGSVQLSVCCLEQLARLFASSQPKVWLECMPEVISCLSSSSSLVVSSTCSCIATMAIQLGAVALPNINKVLPRMLELVEEKAKEEESMEEEEAILCQSAILSVEKIMSNIPHLMSPFVEKFLSCLLHPSLVDPQAHSALLLAAKQARQRLPEIIASRILIPKLCKQREELAGMSRHSLHALFAMLEQLCRSLSQQDVAASFPRIFKFFLDSLDLRFLALAGKASVGGEEAVEVEGAMLAALEALVLKLNESRFKPSFLKLYDWATVLEDKQGATRSDKEAELHSLQRMSRLVTLSRVVNRLGERLKGIMVPYFSYLLQLFLSILSDRSTLFKSLPTSAQTPSSTKKRKRDKEGDQDVAKQLADECTDWVVQALHKCFLYDTIAFTNKERFEALHAPLVALLDDLSCGKERYQTRVDLYLKPAVVQLAVAVQAATGSDLLWKPLNHQLLLRSRSESAMVRFASLQVVTGVVQRLGEEYLSLVPEMLPFIVEVLEDMDEHVETCGRQLVALLETHLGESLNEYLRA